MTVLISAVAGARARPGTRAALRQGAIKLAMQLAQLALPGTVVVLEGAVVIASLPVQPGRNDLEELEQWRVKPFPVGAWENVPLLVSNLQKRALDLAGVDRTNHVILLADHDLLLTETPRGKPAFPLPPVALKLSACVVAFLERAEVVAPPAPPPLATALERACLHSGGTYVPFRGFASDWLGGPLLELLADQHPIRQRHELACGQLSESILVTPASRGLARPLWPPLAAVPRPWAPVLTIVGFVPLANVLGLHTVLACAVVPAAAATATKEVPPLTALLLAHLLRDDRAALVRLAPSSFGYLAVSQPRAGAEQPPGLVLAALDEAETVGWAERLATLDPAAAKTLLDLPSPPRTIMSYSSAKDDQAVQIWLSREALQIRAHQSSLNRIGRMASHLPMPRDLHILLKEMERMRQCALVYRAPEVLTGPVRGRLLTAHHDATTKQNADAVAILMHLLRQIERNDLTAPFTAPAGYRTSSKGDAAEAASK